jgi:ribosomal protein S18 acetylase RimI-like enzyme
MSPLLYREMTGILPAETLVSLGEVASLCFRIPGQPVPSPTRCADQLDLALRGFRWVHLGLAYDGERVVGYKVGRSNDPRTFESWNGGVLPRARRRGVGAELARRQEAWCREQGFAYLSTETASDNRAMLILNLRQGFYVAGTYLDRGKNMKVVLQKALNTEPECTG